MSVANFQKENQMAIQREFLNFNSDNSKEHEADGLSVLVETYFHIYNKSVFNLNSYSNVDSEYQLDHSGVEVLTEEYSIRTEEPMPEFDVEGGETHTRDFTWKITAPKGYVSITIRGVESRIEWSGGKIKDLHGEKAVLTPKFEVMEDLTDEQYERLIEINRLHRIQSITKDSRFQMGLAFKINNLIQQDKINA
jgi:hypothetical protein